MSEVLQLPAPKPSSDLALLEARVIGGVLHLSPTVDDLDAMALGESDFSIELYRNAWQLIRGIAETRQPVSALTIGTAGIRRKQLTAEDVKTLEELAFAHFMEINTLRRVANDLRMVVRARELATNLEAEVRALRSGKFNLATIAQTLETLSQRITREGAVDEDASGDVIEVLDTWGVSEDTGKSRLLPTRIAVIDAELGGLPPGLTVLASSPGVGKTAVMDSMIRAQLEGDPDLHLGFFGLEDGTSHIARRWIAADTGIPLREVGWRKRTDEERRAVEESAERIHPLLKRLHVYRHDTITGGELVMRSILMKSRFNVSGIYVDNLTEVDFTNRRAKEQHFEALAELGRKLRNFGIRSGVAFALIAHTNGDLRPGQIPTINDLAGGQALARRARLFFGLWKKGTAIRCTVGKANELGEEGTTVEFERIVTAALIKPDAGSKVNLQQERREEKKAKKAEADLESVDRAAKKRIQIAERMEKARLDREAAAAKTAQVGLDLGEVK